MNQPWQAAIAYHERSKHHVHRFARSPGYLDWATQPDPFRRYHGAPAIALPFRPSHDGPRYDDLFSPGEIDSAPVTLISIASLFELSLAISAWKQFGESRWALRINPSSGNLHPTEGYLVIGPMDGLTKNGGVFHYAPMEHALEQRAEFDSSRWSDYVLNFGSEVFFIGLSSIHWREAWKYGERAYRYCQHDIGHAVAAVSISAAALGWRTEIVNGIGGVDLASLLGLDRDADFADAELEQADLLLAIIPSISATSGSRVARTDDPQPQASPGADCNHFELRALARATQHKCAAVGDRLARLGKTARWFGRANRLSADHVEWDVIEEVAAACERLSRTDSALHCNTDGSQCEGPGGNVSDRPARPSLAATIIRQRRSAVAFDGRTSISVEQFCRMLDRTLPRFDRPPWRALGPPVYVHLCLFVHRVEGILPGLYCLLRSDEGLHSLRPAMSSSFLWGRPPNCPDGLPLFLLQPGDVRRVAAEVSCGQDIAGSSAFSLGMIAEFETPLRRHGSWVYRRLFWEAGVIGQLLYLEAEAAGVRGTGIGCFLDDAVHDLFGLSGHEYQSLYHFTVGKPVEDSRLVTLSPYPCKADSELD